MCLLDCRLMLSVDLMVTAFLGGVHVSGKVSLC